MIALFYIKCCYKFVPLILLQVVWISLKVILTSVFRVLVNNQLWKIKKKQKLSKH